MHGGLSWNLAEMSRGKICYATFLDFRVTEQILCRFQAVTERQIMAIYEAIVPANTKNRLYNLPL